MSPSRCPLQRNGVGQAVDLFREEERELQDVGSLHLVVSASLEPCGVELSTEAVFNKSAPYSLPGCGWQRLLYLSDDKATLAVPSPSLTWP